MQTRAFICKQAYFPAFSRTIIRMKNASKNQILKNASLVTGMSVLERAIGFLYRIVLARLIGAEGLGIYQVAFSVYAVLHTLGTGGIPVSVSRLISKSKAQNARKDERSALSAGLFLSLLITLPLTLFFYTLGGRLRLFSDARVFPVFQILLLSLSYSAVYDVIRGSFWANKRFFTSGALELAEETAMVILGVLLLRGTTDPFIGAKGVAFSCAIATLFSFVLILVCFLVADGKFASPTTQLKPLLNATLPITSVRLSGSVVNSAIAVLLPAMLLKAGVSSAEAMRLFGVVSGMVTPVLMIPATVIGSLSLVLVPELSEDYYAGNHKRLYLNITRGISVSFLVACLLLPFFFTLGQDFGQLAFSSKLAGEMIRNGCFVVLPVSISMITTGVLNSLGFEKQTFLFYFFGAAATLLCILFLPAVCGIYAYIWGVASSATVTTLCNCLLLRKKCGGLFREHKVFWISLFIRAGVFVVGAGMAGTLFSATFRNFLGQTIAPLCAGVALIAFCALLAWLLFQNRAKK